MTLIESRSDDRLEHPVDVVERLAAVNEWDFDRAQVDEISILVSGRFANYDVAFTWLAEQKSLHVSCSFDLKTPPHKRAAIGELTQLINEQLWLGHFDLWTQQDMVMFRHSLCLAGGAAASDAQCGAVVKAAVNACETYFQAFTRRRHRPYPFRLVSFTCYYVVSRDGGVHETQGVHCCNRWRGGLATCCAGAEYEQGC